MSNAFARIWGRFSDRPARKPSQCPIKNMVFAASSNAFRWPRETLIPVFWIRLISAVHCVEATSKSNCVVSSLFIRFLVFAVVWGNNVARSIYRVVHPAMLFPFPATAVS